MRLRLVDDVFLCGSYRLLRLTRCVLHNNHRIGASLIRTVQQDLPILCHSVTYNHIHSLSRWSRVIGSSSLQYRLYHSTVLVGNNQSDGTRKRPLHRRVWKAKPLNDNTSPESKIDGTTSNNTTAGSDDDLYWTDRVIDQSWKQQQGSTSTATSKEDMIQEFIQRISTQSDVLGGKMPERQLGVLHQDPATDMQLLIDNYTVKAVASALRDREDALQQAATLASENRIDELCNFLQIFHPKYVLERRQQQKQLKQHIRVYNPNDNNNNTSNSNKHSTTNTTITTNDPITALHLDASRQLLRKALMRMPRTITTAHSKRAGVCLPLCLVNGVPSILLEKRARHLRSHPDDVCFPGGMVCDIQDQTIVDTSIREMKEEIIGLTEKVEVIGILRLNWGEVHHLTGVAVTPVVCYLGELPDLSPNPEEVSEVFTIPLMDLLNKSFWIRKDALAPIFVGGPHVIWGLTGYILERFAIELGRLAT